MTTLAAQLTRYIAHQLAQQKPAQRPPVRLNNDKIDPKLAEYEEELDELLDDALTGKIDKATFKDKWETAALAILVLSFAIGSGGKMTAAGRKRLEELEKIAKDSTAGLADDIYSGKYKDGADGLIARKELWVQSAAGAYSEGQVSGDGEIRLKWILDPQKENCEDCQRLNGQVHTAEEWERADIKPGDSQLACGGWRCGCVLMETDEPSQGMEF
jgi:hypothetical protein